MEPPSPIISSRYIRVNDMEMHFLERGNRFRADGKSQSPLIILLHGFPELSYSWRGIMTPLADEGYYVVAPDQRGYSIPPNGLPPSRVKYSDDIAPYRITNLVKDVVALVYALGYTSVAAVVGHDFGSSVAAHCALIRPDLFKSVVLMSTPFGGPPELLFDVNGALADTSKQPEASRSGSIFPKDVDPALAQLDRARKHYTTYFSTPDAEKDMIDPPGGLHAFLRTYFHVKSADWNGNREPAPHRLPDSTAKSLAALPTYYIMPLNKTMPEAISPYSPSPSEIATKSNRWLPDEELSIYVDHFTKIGFQGGLNRYRVVKSAEHMSELAVFSGKKIEVPAMYVSGRMDWGVWQNPGAVETMRESACVKRMEDEEFVLVDEAGHWVQQERPDVVVGHLIRFLRKYKVA